MQDFFKAIGAVNKSKAASEKEDATTEENPSSDNDNIDDPSLSRLTAGQHERYLKLLSSTNVRTNAERKEFHNLSLLIQAEQIRYRQALIDFHSKHSDRYNPTKVHQHPALPFFSWACIKSFPSNVHQSSKISATKFGKCRQRISLPQLQQQSRHNPPKKLDLLSLRLEVVHVTEPSDTFPTVSAEILSFGRRILPPVTPKTPFPVPLDQDDQLRSLAEEYYASIATTADTLEALLGPSGAHGSQWMVPLTAKACISPQESTSIRFLGPPVPQAYATPRDCIEHGLQEGLYQCMQEEEGKQESKQDEILYVYTLWILPPVRRQSLRLLIRSTIRCQTENTDEDGSTTKNPVILRVHAEYFCDRQVVEIPNAYERARWIMDQLLLGKNDANTQNNGSVRWVRVDAQTCQIVGSEEVSFAHALAIGEAQDHPNNHNSNYTDPILPLESLVHILQSLSTLDGDQASLLCLDSQQHSVSVHAAVCTDNDSKDTSSVAIDLESLPNANGVVLTAEALMSCARDWKWNSTNRVSNTFPVKSAKTKSQLLHPKS